MAETGSDDANLESRIGSYWSVQPPFRAANVEHGSLAWSRSISDHRYHVMPYLRTWAGFEAHAGERVLEIGCGAGTDLCAFARGGAHVTGVDITKTAIDLTTRRLAVEQLEGRALGYDGRQLPFANASFDLVYCFGVLHHTPYMDDLLAEIHRVLVPGGQAKMMLYHRHSLLYHYSIVYLRQWKQAHATVSREAALSQYSEFRAGCPYTRVFSTDEMKTRLWFFDRVESGIDYCVYDRSEGRKHPGDRTFDIERTGIADLDHFFAQFNDAVRRGDDLRRYGWHLLVRATRGFERTAIG